MCQLVFWPHLSVTAAVSVAYTNNHITWTAISDRHCTAQYNCSCLPATTDCRRFCPFVCYPPFASIAKGEVFVLLYVCSFVNDFSTTRGPIHAKVRMQAYSGSGRVFSPFGNGGPWRAEKGANEIFVTMGVNGEFLHFGGF